MVTLHVCGVLMLPCFARKLAQDMNAFNLWKKKRGEERRGQNKESKKHQIHNQIESVTTQRRLASLILVVVPDST